MKIDAAVSPADLLTAIRRMWEVSGAKIISIDRTMNRSKGAPVHTVAGRYQPRGWTDWTQGFEFELPAALSDKNNGSGQADRCRRKRWVQA